jgi:hypothetical protein
MMGSPFSEFQRGTSKEPHQNAPSLLAQGGKPASSRDAVRALIAKVDAMHAAGRGTLTLADIVKMAGIEKAPPQLHKRGNIDFERKDEQGGTFRNAGEAFEFTQEIEGRDVQVSIPATLGGRYRVTSHQLTLTFDAGRRITASKAYVGSVTIVSLTATESAVTPVVETTGLFKALHGKLSEPRKL